MKNTLVNIAVLAVSSISLAAVAAPAHMTKKVTAVVKHPVVHIKKGMKQQKGKLTLTKKAVKKAKRAKKVASSQVKKNKA